MTTQQRQILPAIQIHSAIQHQVAVYQRDVVNEVQTAINQHAVVVVGMGINPLCKKARRALDQANVAHHYLEYGSYFAMWRTRLALKMYTGWATFPMVFINGNLVGGCTDLQLLIKNGALHTALKK